MKKYCSLLFFISFLFASYAQTYMKLDFLSYYDKSKIDSIIGQQNYDKYLIYQTMLQGDSMISSENEDQIATFLFWLKNDTVFVKLFTKDFIYVTEKGVNNCIFNYKYIEKVGADLKEDNLKFVPPVLAPFMADVVIYRDSTEKFFFEFGSVHLYTENTKKYKYRKEFIEMIRKEAELKLGKYKPESNNLRQPLFDSAK